MFRSLALSVLLIAAANVQCSVCGDGLAITIPDAIFVFPGQPSASYTILQFAGNNGLIPVSEYAFLPAFIGVCECAPATPAPAVAATSVPPVAVITSMPFAGPSCTQWGGKTRKFNTYAC